MVKHNLRMHELAGLFLIFVGASWLGMALYGSVWAANADPISGREIMFFPIYYGFGAVLVALGAIELRWLAPGKRR